MQKLLHPSEHMNHKSQISTTGSIFDDVTNNSVNCYVNNDFSSSFKSRLSGNIKRQSENSDLEHSFQIRNEHENKPIIDCLNTNHLGSTLVTLKEICTKSPVNIL